MILEVFKYSLMKWSPSISLSLVQMVSFCLTQSCVELPFLYYNNVTQVLILLKKQNDFFSILLLCESRNVNINYSDLDLAKVHSHE